MKSKTPREELAFCLAARGHCLLENLRFNDAAEAFAYASEMEPSNELHRSCVQATLNRWDRQLRWLGSDRGPEVEHAPVDCNGFPNLPVHLAERMGYLKRLDAAIAIERQDELLAEQADAARREEEANLPEIEFQYTWPPSE